MASGKAQPPRRDGECERPLVFGCGRAQVLKPDAAPQLVFAAASAPADAPATAMPPDFPSSPPLAPPPSTASGYPLSGSSVPGDDAPTPRAVANLLRFLNATAFKQPVLSLPGSLVEQNGAPAIELVEFLSGSAVPGKVTTFSGLYARGRWDRGFVGEVSGESDSRAWLWIMVRFLRKPGRRRLLLRKTTRNENYLLPTHLERQEVKSLERSGRMTSKTSRCNRVSKLLQSGNGAKLVLGGAD